MDPADRLEEFTRLFERLVSPDINVEVKVAWDDPAFADARQKVENKLGNLQKSAPDIVDSATTGILSMVHEKIAQADEGFAGMLLKAHPDIAEKIKNFKIPEQNRAQLEQTIEELAAASVDDFKDRYRQKVQETILDSVERYRQDIRDHTGNKLDQIKQEGRDNYSQGAINIAETLYPLCTPEGNNRAFAVQAIQATQGEQQEMVLNALNDKLKANGHEPLYVDGVSEPVVGTAPTGGMAP